MTKLGMPLSKLWLFVVTLLVGLLSLGLLLLVPELRRVVQGDADLRIQLAHKTAALLLRGQASQLVEAATHLGSDAVLRSSLEEMARGQAELDLLHRTAQAELQKLNQPLGAALLILVDSKGRVLARLGQDEAVYRDPLGGVPLVEEAARGYRLDDLWLLHGTLYRVAAAPVISLGRDRYVGALLVGQVLSSALADELHRTTGAEALFVVGDRVLAASLSPTQLTSRLGPDGFAVLERARQQALKAGLSAGAERPSERPLVTTLSSGDPLVFVELPGTAAPSEGGAALALITPGGARLGLPLLLQTAAARGLPPAILGALILGMALLFALGLGFLRLDVARRGAGDSA